MYMIRANLLISLVMLKLISRYAELALSTPRFTGRCLRLFSSCSSPAGYGKLWCILRCGDVFFFANARWTFSSAATPLRYLLYVSFMGGMAALVGWMADACTLSRWLP